LSCIIKSLRCMQLRQVFETSDGVPRVFVAAGVVVRVVLGVHAQRRAAVEDRSVHRVRRLRYERASKRQRNKALSDDADAIPVASHQWQQEQVFIIPSPRTAAFNFGGARLPSLSLLKLRIPARKSPPSAAFVCSPVHSMACTQYNTQHHKAVAACLGTNSAALQSNPIQCSAVHCNAMDNDAPGTRC